MTAGTVTLCGSMRHFPVMLAEAGRLTAQGYVVHLPVPAEAHPSLLASVHYRKIDASDEVRVVDPDGYIGDSTRQEITYAERRGLPVTFMSTDDASRSRPPRPEDSHTLPCGHPTADSSLTSQGYVFCPSCGGPLLPDDARSQS